MGLRIKLLTCLGFLLFLFAPVTRGQYAVGEPMAEPEPYPDDRNTSAALNIIDIIHRGGFALAASQIANFTVHTNVTCPNVSYPVEGAGTKFFVDVKALAAPPGDMLEIKISDCAKVSVDTKELNETQAMAISLFHSMTPEMFGKQAVEHHHVGEEDPTSAERSHFIPGNIAAVSLHTLSGLANKSFENSTEKKSRVSLFSGPVNYTVCLTGQYATVFKAVTSLPGRLIGWRWDCGRWEKRGRRWSTNGCSLVEEGGNPTMKTCSCEANANSSTFSLILEVETQSTVPNLVLALCIVFESVSIISLLIAFVTLLCLRRALQASTEERNKSRGDTANHINLCAALVLLHLSVLLRPVGILHSASCELIAVLTHYFLLVSGAWMLAEGIYLYRRTCSNAGFSRETASCWRHFATYVVLPWISPAILVGFCFGVYFPWGEYMDHSAEYEFMMTLRRSALPTQSELDLTPEYPKYTICWLNPTMTYAAAVPLALMLFPNVVIAILVSTRVWHIKRLDGTRHNASTRSCERKNNSVRKRPLHAVSSAAGTNAIRSQPVVASFRAFLILLPILGVPWIGTFVGVVPGAESYITALHLLASSLQGLLVACVVCLVNRDVRKALRRKLRLNCRCFAGAKVSVSPPPV